jgi:hypothetical protein
MNSARRNLTTEMQHNLMLSEHMLSKVSRWHHHFVYGIGGGHCHSVFTTRLATGCDLAGVGLICGPALSYLE